MSLLMDALRRAEAEKRAAGNRDSAAPPEDSFELTLEPSDALASAPPGSVTGEFALPINPGERETGPGSPRYTGGEPTLVDDLALLQTTLRGTAILDEATLGRPERVTPHTVFAATGGRRISRHTAVLAVTTALVMTSLALLSYRYWVAMTPSPMIPSPRTAMTVETPVPPPPGPASPPSLEVVPALPEAAPAPAAPATTETVEASPPAPPPVPPTVGTAPAPTSAPPSVMSPAQPMDETSREAEMRNGDLRIERTRSGQSALAARLTEAYAALERGDLARARPLYEALLAGAPDLLDAHLGLGAIALSENRLPEAHGHYARVLGQSPDHPVATAALFLIEGGQGRLATATRVKLLLDRGLDAPYLQFALGNFHAREQRWGDAQQAYFAAFSGQPRNADYAFNLAVSLDRLGQRPAARDYYQRALDLRGPRSTFDPAAANARLAALTAR